MPETYINFLLEYGLFLLKTITVIFGLIIILGFIANAKKTKSYGSLKIKKLNDELDEYEDNIKKNTLNKIKYQKHLKAKKLIKKNRSDKKIFILDFKGNIKASEVTSLREEISSIILAASKHDEVLIRLENAGGTVHEHGLAASQIKRLKKHKIKITISVDKVAASGGYMMACVANKIIAAPFAIVGSIGVLAQLPNFNRLLSRKGIDFEQQQAGDYKRTVTMFGKNTNSQRKKLKEQLEDIHELFKNFIKHERPNVDIKKVSTGEYWYGERAKNLRLIDEIMTSDEFILDKKDSYELIKVEYALPKSISDKISSVSSKIIKNILDNLTLNRA